MNPSNEPGYMECCDIDIAPDLEWGRDKNGIMDVFARWNCEHCTAKAIKRLCALDATTGAWTWPPTPIISDHEMARDAAKGDGHEV